MDIHQDVARSSYADMLHDDERNHAYFAAIRVAVSFLTKSKIANPTNDRHFKCCDIGTGSGLLSMMIVSAFKEVGYENYDITSYEAFKPMAECAQKVIEKNEMSKHITVISSRLEDCKSKVLFDLITAELLDTELIGEGCLTTYRFTVENLSSPDCIFIPKEARVYIQPIISNYLYSRQTIDDLNLEFGTKRISVKVPDIVKNCCGMPEVDDLQTHNLNDIVELADPAIAFHFKFDLMQGLSLRNSESINFELKNPVTSTPMIIMWWNLIMINESLFNQYHDPSEYRISFSTLSCAPSWIRNCKDYHEHYYEDRDSYIKNLYGRRVWREHWIRGIYHFGDTRGARALVGQIKGSPFSVHAYHDSHSLWFDITPSDSKIPKSCNCGVHRSLSRSELSFLNGTHGDIEKLLKATITSSGVEVNELHPIGRFVFASINSEISDTDSSLSLNEHKWIIQLSTSDQSTIRLIDLSMQDEISWRKLLERSVKNLSLDPISSFEVVCLHVVFEDLSRIRDKIISCEGFDLGPLDEMIDNSIRRADESVDSLFLWEYDSFSLGPVISIYQMGDLILANSKTERNLTLKSAKKVGQALVFWTNLKLLDGSSISTGPIGNIESDNEVIRWNRNYKQLVHFIQDSSNNANHNIIDVSIELSIDELKVATKTSLNPV